MWKHRSRGPSWIAPAALFAGMAVALAAQVVWQVLGESVEQASIYK